MHDKGLFYLGEVCDVYKLSELHDKIGQDCIIIGTLFKHQELKPSILKEISEEVTFNLIYIYIIQISCECVIIMFFVCRII